MAPRLELHQILSDIEGVLKVHFQPPENVELEYPCIKYIFSDQDPTYADNIPYWLPKKYQVTVIDRNPDSEIPDHVASLPTSRFDRRYVADNLNHTVYNLSY